MKLHEEWSKRKSKLWFNLNSNYVRELSLLCGILNRRELKQHANSRKIEG
jgi:hypothetical protein